MATATLSAASVPIPAATTESPVVLPPDELLYEWVDGHIVELPPMGILESELAFTQATALHEAARAQRLGKVVVELLFRIDVDRNLKRRPDLAFVSRSRWPYGKRVPDADAWDIVPDLAVEVVSDSNSANEIIVKIGDYFRTGARLVWVVYPVVRQVYVYSSAMDVRILDGSAELDGVEVVPGFRMPLPRLFEDEPDAESTATPGPNGSPGA
jgi:Uma2 family endonuclease